MIISILKIVKLEEVSMKKKFLSGFLLSLILSLGIGGAVASAAETSTFDLNKGMTSATTSRITINSGENLTFSISTYTTNLSPLGWTLFKSGVAYLSGHWDGVNNHYLEKTYNVPNGDYSLRVYCNSKSSPETNCNAYGAITDNH